MRAVVVTNIARPYRHALFNEIATRLEDGSLHVVYTSSQAAQPRRRGVRFAPEDAAYTSAAAAAWHLPSSGGRAPSVAYGVGRALAKARPDVAVIAGFGPDALLAHRWCRRSGVPAVVWSGGWPEGEPAVSAMRTRMRQRTVGRAAASVAYGTLARDYLVSLGGPPERAFLGTNTVDLEVFASAAEAARRDSDRTRVLGKGADTHLVCVGSLEHRKGIDLLLEAAALLAARRSAWRIHLAGSGPMEGHLRARAAEAGLGDAVWFHGFLQEEDVSRLYGICDGAVFPTRRDVWGLVVNEAQACGLALVSSVRAGATHDLVDDGSNGLAVDPEDTAALAAAIERLLDPATRDAFGSAAARTVRERASLGVSAAGFIAAMDAAVRGGADA